MQANRRSFLKTAGIIVAGLAVPGRAFGVGAASQVHIAQLVYPGGNWRPRPTALRRLAWEIHKRTAVDAALEPIEAKAKPSALAASPLVYVSGDRTFPDWSDSTTQALKRFIRLGGTLIIDPALDPGRDAAGFDASIDKQIERILPGVTRSGVPPDHVLYRSFYQITRPVGRVEGPKTLTGHETDGRLAIIRTKHDLGGAWARDNLGNWEHEVVPGGERQRESAFRLGINLVLYALCLDYKNEEPHRRFNRQIVEE